MARYFADIDVAVPLNDAFAYLRDFQNVVEWDPGIARAEKITKGPVGPGARFHVVSSFLGREVALVYEIEKHEPPHRVVLVGRADGLTSTDEITLRAIPGGTRVRYDARLDLAGVRRLFDPLLWAVFQVIGARAAAGLRRRLGTPRVPSGAAPAR